MKLLIVTAIDPYTLKPGGTESYVMNLINSIKNYNIEVTMIGISQRQNHTQPNFNFISINKNSKISNYKFLLTLLLKAPFLKIPKSAVIHVQRPDMMLPFILYFKNNKKICTLHGLPANGIFLKKGKLIGKMYLLIEKYCLKNADALIAVSEETKFRYMQEYPWIQRKVNTISIGFDEKKFRLMDKNEMRKKYKFNLDDKIVLYAGRFEKEKNLDFLLKSFSLVAKKNLGSKLILVGSGREKEKLQILSKELKIDTNFLNPVEQDILAELINCADVFALTSTYESGPLAVLESLACGVPVVTTDVGRVREFIVTEKCGRIVKRDERKFANAIDEILNYPNKKNKDLCRQIVINFSFNVTAKKTVELYRLVNSEN